MSKIAVITPEQAKKARALALDAYTKSFSGGPEYADAAYVLEAQLQAAIADPSMGLGDEGVREAFRQYGYMALECLHPSKSRHPSLIKERTDLMEQMAPGSKLLSPDDRALARNVGEQAFADNVPKVELAKRVLSAGVGRGLDDALRIQFRQTAYARFDELAELSRSRASAQRAPEEESDLGL